MILHAVASGTGPVDDHAAGEEDTLTGRPGRRQRCRAHPRRPSRRKRRRRTGEVREGVVLASSRRNLRVRTPGGDVICYLPGRLHRSEKPIAGDHVRLNLLEDGEGALEEVLPRRNVLSRVSEDDGSKVRAVAANVDCLVTILSASPFPPRWSLADRLLALCDREGFEEILVVNKIDRIAPLSPESKEIERCAAIYRGLGVAVLLTSAIHGEGVKELKEAVSGKVAVFSGHSGVGKSSLLNAIHPEWNLLVAEVNPLTQKGRHTTSLARLLDMPGGGFAVDTPGFREFGLGDVPPPDLGRYYREFRPRIADCRFPDCLHRNEPGCAVKEAVRDGAVSELRYQNYLQILQGLLEKGRR